MLANLKRHHPDASAKLRIVTYADERVRAAATKFRIKSHSSILEVAKKQPELGKKAHQDGGRSETLHPGKRLKYHKTEGTLLRKLVGRNEAEDDVLGSSDGCTPSSLEPSAAPGLVGGDSAAAATLQVAPQALFWDSGGVGPLSYLHIHPHPKAQGNVGSRVGKNAEGGVHLGNQMSGSTTTGLLGKVWKKWADRQSGLCSGG